PSRSTLCPYTALFRSGRHAARDAGDDASNGISARTHLFDERNHSLRRGGIRAADDVRLDLVRGYGVRIDLGGKIFDLRNIGQHLDRKSTRLNSSHVKI